MGTDNNLNDIDPDIAELLAIDDAPESDSAEKPDFFDLFDDESRPPASESFLEGDEESQAPQELEIKAQFPEITKFEEDPKPYFNDKDYYKIALAGEGQISQRVHTLLSTFLKPEGDPKDKTANRERLISAYWELLGSVAGKTGSSLPIPKKMMMRFGVILPTLINKDQRFLLSKIIENNDTGEPIYYVDEWLSKVSTGEIPPSTADESKKAKTGGKPQSQKASAALEKERGQRDALLTTMKTKSAAISDVERMISDKVAFLKKHSMLPNYNNVLQSYSPEQKAVLAELQELAKKALQYDKELASATDNIAASAAKVADLEQRAREEGSNTVSVGSEVLIEEFKTIRQMAKMSVGRKGNHFPILLQQYMKANLKEIATRENIIASMAEIEKVDPGIFKRTFKRQTNRIVPYTIIVPSYGEFGVCWEPFAKFNKGTSKGRIAIPLFPKDLKSALIYALGDLRWQVAKETASYYWMEEGLTGWYYQWFTDQKMRGDVKESFIANYFLWITKEADGMQKLDKDVRGIFWRNMPFPAELKERLRNRGFVYNELYKKDTNIAMSDGY